jgi:hypothetical protein
MKILATAIVAAITMAWTASAEAQSKKSGVRKATTATHQKVTTRRATAAQGRPCVGYNWTGCIGWDPDPLIRATLLRDAGRNDD